MADLGLADRVTVQKLDVLDPSDIKAATRWDFDTFVSNAGAADCAPMAEIPVELVRRIFETNVFSNLELTQHVIRVIAADDGKYRNVWPPATEELIKQVQESGWTRPLQPPVSEPA